MKRTGLLLTLLFLATTLTFGQRISIGAELGASASNNNDSPGLILSRSGSSRDIALETRRITYFAGVNAKYKLRPRFSLATGLHYLRQGDKHPACEDAEVREQNQAGRKIDYLAVPVLANLKLLKPGKLIASMGLAGAYNTRAVSGYPNSNDACTAHRKNDLRSKTRAFALYGIVGLGYELIYRNKIEVIPNLRYYQGLTASQTPEVAHLPILYNSVQLTMQVNYNL